MHVVLAALHRVDELNVIAPLSVPAKTLNDEVINTEVSDAIIKLRIFIVMHPPIK